MPSSDPRDRARNILRGLSEHEADRRGLSPPPPSSTPEPDRARLDPLRFGDLAVKSQLLRADQLEECLREMKEREARGVPAELIDIILGRGWITPEAVTQLLASAERPPGGFPTIGRFEIRECVGEGTSAVVYRAWDKNLHRWVALKVLRSKFGLSGVARERFRREARASAGLAHPHVVTVHDAGEENGQLYLVMEFVQGRPFSDVLAEGKLSRRELLVLLEKIARGMAAAHERRIVHRDLKPANFILTESGEPKVGDFGLAHLTDDPAALTRTGTTLGTPLYMSPEQVEGRSKDISPRTDVYALGAILYEILAGRPPHVGELTLDLYRQIVQDAPLPPRRQDPKVSPDLEAVVLKALEKEPERRYPSAKEFADDLGRYLAGEPVRARRPGVGRLAWRSLRRHRLGVTIGVVLLLAAGFSAAVSWKVSRKEERPPEREGSAAPSRAARKTPAPLPGAGNIPVHDLALWYRADAGLTRRGSRISRWDDQSGYGRDAVQSSESNQPLWVERAVHGRPVVRFDGGSSFMSFTMPVNGLRGMTIILVSASASDLPAGRNGDRSAINWDETSFWGRVYVSPFRSNIRFRFGTTQTDNWPIYSKSPSNPGTFSIITAMKDESVDLLYLDGALVLREEGKQPAISSCLDSAMLGKGMASDCFAGDIAEVLVYSSALPDPDRRRVEDYLSERYGLRGGRR